MLTIGGVKRSIVAWRMNAVNYTSFQQGGIVKRPTANGFTWTLRYREDGKHKALKLGTNEELPTQKDAERKASTLLAVINAGREKITFGQLAEKYMKEEIPSRPQTAASYRTAIKHLRAKFEDVPLESMLKDLMVVKAWIGGLKSFPTETQPARPLSKKTKQNIKATLHRLIECAMLWGYLAVERNPIGLVEVKTIGIQPPKRLKVPLTTKQVWALLNYEGLPESVRVMAKLSVFLGLRISEVLGLKWEDVDFERKVIKVVRSCVGNHVDETKTTASNDSLPLHDFVVVILKDWQKASVAVNGWMFGNVATGRPFHRDTLQFKYLAPAGKALGIVNLGWHSLRHSYRAFLRALNTDPETQQLLMRHANLSTTMEYGVDDPLMEVKRPANEALVEALLKGK